MYRLPYLLKWLLAALLISLPAYAQWPVSPDVNLLICSQPGEQVLPKIAAAPDGGCYLSWFDQRAGSYRVYMQRLDAAGVPQWAENGLLISSHPQETWLTDYDLTVDAAGYAIVAFNDSRAGGDWDIYAYRMSPAGDFVWGANGLTISDNTDFEAAPRVSVTSAGNIVIAWIRETAAGVVINLRKVSPAGADLWSPPIITITHTYSLSVPRLAAADADAVILQYVQQQGAQYWSPKFIYMQKFSANGEMQWPGAGVLVSNAGGLGPQMLPDLVSDGDGGAYGYWYDTHDANRHHVYVQHVLFDGTAQWTANGVQASLSASEMQMSPTLSRIPGTQDVVLFYMTSDPDQNNWGLGGQRLDAAGTRRWTDNGHTYAALNDQQRFFIEALPQQGGAMVVYLEFFPGSLQNTAVRGFRVDTEGNLWPGGIRVLSSVVSAKGRLVSTVNLAGQVITAWSDQRGDANDIYLQNINPDGTLGPFAGQPPSPFSLIEPVNNDTLANQLVTFVWHVSQDPDGQSVAYDLVTQCWNQSVRTSLTDTTAEHTWFDITGLPEHDWVPVTWWVEAISAGDTTHSTETWQFVIPQVTAADDPGAAVSACALHQNYPNPFNPSTSIRYDLQEAGVTRLSVCNLSGQEVAVLVNEVQPAGTYRVNFDAASLPSGIYFYRMQSGSFVQTAKMVLLK